MQTYPVKNKFPILALEKLNTELGRALLTISKLTRLNTDRMSSRFSLEMLVQSSARPSTISSHCSRACVGSDESL